jgi:Tfp pilus assembly protein PilN
MDKLINIFGRIKKAVGLEIILSQDKNWNFNLVVVKLEKSIVKIISKKTGINDPRQLKEEIPNNLPLILSICGKGLLFKKTSNTGSIVNLREVFPGVDPKDFYYQAIDVGEHKYVALLRLNILDSILAELQKEDFYVYDVFLGPLAMHGALPLLSGLSRVCTTAYELEIVDQGIWQIAPHGQDQSTSYKIGGDDFISSELLAYASAISPFLKNTLEESDNTPVAMLKDEWQQKSFYKKAGTAVLAFFFTILLINMFLYMDVSKTNDELKGEARHIQALVVQLETLKKDVETRNQFIESIGWSKSSKIAFYADQLALTTPNQINWTELVLHPTDDERLKRDKKKYFMKDRLRVKGKCKDPVILNNWLKELEKSKWVKAIEGQEFRHDYQENTGLFNFSIVLK